MAGAWEALRPAVEAATGLRTWNPGVYGRAAYERFVAHYSPPGPGGLLALGLNPGKYGMSQTGIPFTDVATARAALPLVRFDLDPPGLAPSDLVPFLGSYRRERSCQSVYGFLEAAYGSAEAGWRDVWVANPCSLLFLTPQGENVTPADARVARAPGVRALRERAVADAIEAARPRGVLFLGQDVARLGTPIAEAAVGAERVVTLDHPVARGPGRRGPKWWAETVTARLREAGLLP